MKALFKVNDYVVYPLHGIGIVSNVFPGESEEERYRIKLIDSNMIIEIPGKSVEQTGLRKIITKSKIKGVIDSFSEPPSSSQENWRIRLQDNIEKLKSGNVEPMITLIKQLFLRNKQRSLSAIERSQYENAFKNIVREVSIVMKSDEKAVNQMLSSKLNELSENSEDKVEKNKA